MTILSTHVDIEKHFGGVDTVERFDLSDTSCVLVWMDGLVSRLGYLWPQLLYPLENTPNARRVCAVNIRK